jgi:predicted PhzF superfamily epimerase YddE/YHI9
VTRLPYYVINTFTSRPFAGNPAGVCPLEAWLPDELMQRIATENNLSETAFFVRAGDRYALRWFAPGGEVDLCGHATLAAAFVLTTYLGASGDTLRFDTRSGELRVRRRDLRLELDFPLLPLNPVAPPPALLRGLGVPAEAVLFGMDYVAVLASEEAVAALRPAIEEWRSLDGRGVVVTAVTADGNYVCRCFAPNVGITEDPVTGSAQCALAPYWSGRLGKTAFQVRQLSKRGGLLEARVEGDRVLIGGDAAPYLTGEISV